MDVTNLAAPQRLSSRENEDEGKCVVQLAVRGVDEPLRFDPLVASFNQAPTLGLRGMLTHTGDALRGTG